MNNILFVYYQILYDKRIECQKIFQTLIEFLIEYHYLQSHINILQYKKYQNHFLNFQIQNQIQNLHYQVFHYLNLN